MSDWKFNKVSEHRGALKAFRAATSEQIKLQKDTGQRHIMTEEAKGLFVVYAVTRYNEPCRTWEPVPAI